VFVRRYSAAPSGRVAVWGRFLGLKPQAESFYPFGLGTGVSFRSLLANSDFAVPLPAQPSSLPFQGSDATVDLKPAQRLLANGGKQGPKAATTKIPCPLKIAFISARQSITTWKPHL